MDSVSDCRCFEQWHFPLQPVTTDYKQYIVSTQCFLASYIVLELATDFNYVHRKYCFTSSDNNSLLYNPVDTYIQNWLHND